MNLGKFRKVVISEKRKGWSLITEDNTLEELTFAEWQK